MNKILYVLLCFTTLSCGQGFLDVKPSSSTVVPTTLDDFEQLMNYGNLMYAYPDMLDVLADDYYLDGTYWQSMRNIIQKNAYVWADDIFETLESDLPSWERSYSQIFYANVVLEGVDEIVVNDKNKIQHNQVKGTALFLRAWALYNLVQLYAPAYNTATASIDLAVPIPLLSDVNEKVERNSVEEVYSRILKDLKEATIYVKEVVDYGSPSKAAVYALKARVLLSMGNYKNALTMATNSISRRDALVDLNLEAFDYKKSLYMGFDPNGPLIDSYNTSVLVASELYTSYTLNDLRKSFFRLNSKGQVYMFSPYNLSGYHFKGLDTDEQYLIQAECQARNGDKDEAMKTLNHLLKYYHSDYVNKVANTKEEALTIILQERRKQLLFRGLRWSDLKRYNRDGANITLIRQFGDKFYTLPPNSPKWLFPIPPNEIKTSGLIQNIR